MYYTPPYEAKRNSYLTLSFFYVCRKGAYGSASEKTQAQAIIPQKNEHDSASENDCLINVWAELRADYGLDDERINA